MLDCCVFPPHYLPQVRGWIHWALLAPCCEIALRKSHPLGCSVDKGEIHRTRCQSVPIIGVKIS